MLVNTLPHSFLNTRTLSTSFLEGYALCSVISFLVLWSICLSSYLVHYKNGPEYLTRGTTQVFIPLIRFLLIQCFRVTFSSPEILFFNFFFHLNLLLLLFTLESFSDQFLLMVFHWSLNDNESPQVFRNLLSILGDLNNAVIWMVSTCSLISKFSSPF